MSSRGGAADCGLVEVGGGKKVMEGKGKGKGKGVSVEDEN